MKVSTRGKVTHAFGVPLRTRKFRSQVRIGAITHAYTNEWVKAKTLCGISYTHTKNQARNHVVLATRTSREVDCMACLAGKT